MIMFDLQISLFCLDFVNDALKKYPIKRSYLLSKPVDSVARATRGGNIPFLARRSSGGAGVLILLKFEFLIILIEVAYIFVMC
jgi:hypothetical protein